MNDEQSGPAHDVLLKDFELLNANLQNQYTRMHNRLQLTITLNTALLAAIGALAGDGEFYKWLLLIPAAGLTLSAIGLVAGLEDRRLVERYRLQIRAAAARLAGDGVTVPGRLDALPSSGTWFHAGVDTAELRKAFAVEADPSWRLTPTRLPWVLGAVFSAIWIAVGVALAGSIWWW